MTRISEQGKRVWLVALAAILLCCLAYIVLSKTGHLLPLPWNPTPEAISQTGSIDTAPDAEQASASLDAKNTAGESQTEASQQQAGTQEPTTAAQTIFVQLTNVSVDGKILRIRSVIQTIDAAGQCRLTLSQTGSSPIVQTVKTQTMASYTSCQGFDIDKSSMSAGKWAVTLDYIGSNKRSGTASEEISL